MIFGKDREEFDVCIVTLHVGGNLEEAAHKRAGPQIVEYILLIVEEGLHQSLRVGIFVAEVLTTQLTISTRLFHQTIPRLVQIILQ